MSSAPETRHVHRVSELNRRIRAVLEDEVGYVWVEGECSNVSRPASGHIYFTLKDEQAQVSAVLFRGSQQGLKIHPDNGLQVRVGGEITVYERGGRYQLLVRDLEPAGVGALQELYERRRQQFLSEGLFDSERKRPLPLLPRKVGVVTSATGAAIRDILQVIQRRFPRLHVVVSPTRVQGDGAAEEIAAALNRVNRYGVDVIICGRGGGSLEDLWSFNEEVVVRAIAASKAPVISAVGHEVDTTLADLVADLRAPTPSAAAELVINREEEFHQTLDRAEERLLAALQNRLDRLRHRTRLATGHYVFREPAHAVARHRHRVEQARHGLADHLRAAVRHPRRQLDRAHSALLPALTRPLPELHTRTSAATRRLQPALTTTLRNTRHRLDQAASRLRALDPQQVLKRGFSITLDDSGRVVHSVKDLDPEDRIETRLADGRVTATVHSITPDQDTP